MLAFAVVEGLVGFCAMYNSVSLGTVDSIHSVREQLSRSLCEETRVRLKLKNRARVRVRNPSGGEGNYPRLLEIQTQRYIPELDPMVQKKMKTMFQHFFRAWRGPGVCISETCREVERVSLPPQATRDRSVSRE